MAGALKRLGLVRVDKHLPAHHVRAGWPLRYLASVALVPLFIACIAAGFAWLYMRERGNVEAILARDSAVERRVTIVYDQDGILCKVQAGREAIAPIILDTCQMAARLIALRERK